MSTPRITIVTCCRPLWLARAFPTCRGDFIGWRLPFFQMLYAVLGLSVVLLPLSAAAQTSSPADRADQSGQTPTVEQEVLRNILHQPIGEQTVDTLNLPDPFLRRVADRIIRASYQQRYHVVVPDEDAALPGTTQPHTASNTVPAAGTVRNVPAATTHRSWPYWAGLGLLIAAACAVMAMRRSRVARP